MIRFLINFILIVIFPMLMRINDIVEMIVFIGYWLLFIILGIIFMNYKGERIFSIIYDKPKDVLEKYYDKKTLFRFEGKSILIQSFGFLPVIAGAYFNTVWLMIIGFVYLIIILICFTIYSKNGKRFRK